MAGTIKKNYGRDFQTLNVSLKKDLIRKIDEVAVRERRTRINTFVVLVERGLTVKEGVSA